MPRYVARILSSFVSLVLLLVMVFFLSRLTGDPAALFLPIDATPEMVENFRELHGLNDPLIVQFGATSGTCCASTSARACARRGPPSTWCCRPSSGRCGSRSSP